MININIKVLNGDSFNIAVQDDMDIDIVKHIIQDYTENNLEVEEQRLIYNGKHMEDYNTLKDFNVKDGHTINVILNLKGGAIGVQQTIGKKAKAKAKAAPEAKPMPKVVPIPNGAPQSASSAVRRHLRPGQA